jgi:acetolactate synthase I/II/III large subunit
MEPQSRAESMQVYHALAEEVRRQGVEQVFGLMGEDTAKLVIELDRLGVSFIATRHENQAVGAADAYARVSGKLGVALLTSGPGFTNALTLLTTASRAGSRVVVMVGAKLAREDEPGYEYARRGKYFPYLATCDALGIPFIKLREASTAIAEVRRGFGIAASGKTVLLNLPVDVLESGARRTVGAVVSPAATSPLAPDPDQIALIADLLRETWAVSRPLILAGRGAVAGGAGPALRRLGELTGAALATTLPAMSFFAGDDFNIGVCGTFSTSLAIEVITRADWVLAFGASLNVLTTDGGSLLRTARVIQVDADQQAFGRYIDVEPEFRLLADTRLAAEGIVARLGRRRQRSAGVRVAALRERIRAFDPRTEFRDQSLPDKIDPRTLMVELDQILPRERIVVVDPGHHLGFSARYLRVSSPRAFVFPIEAGSIGVGMGAAIGAAFASPGKTVVLGVGDAALMMALGDVETAVRYRLPVVIVVSNDMALGAEVHYLDTMGEPTELAKHSTPSFASVADALGAEGHTIESMDDLRPLQKRFQEPIDSPVVLDCYVNPEIRGEWVDLVHGSRMQPKWLRDRAVAR